MEKYLIGSTENNNVRIELWYIPSGYETIVTDKVNNKTYNEEHSDYDHVINNLICYGINYYTIMSLMEEHESKDGKSFHKDNADLTNWVYSNIKKKEVSENYEYEHYDQFWKISCDRNKKVFKKSKR